MSISHKYLRGLSERMLSNMNDSKLCAMLSLGKTYIYIICIEWIKYKQTQNALPTSWKAYEFSW